MCRLYDRWHGSCENFKYDVDFIVEINKKYFKRVDELG